MPRRRKSGATATFITCQRVHVARDERVADELALLAERADRRPSRACAARRRTSIATTASGTTPLDHLDRVEVGARAGEGRSSREDPSASGART